MPRDSNVAVQQQDTLRLRKVALRYDRVEDRIRMDAQSDQGAVVGFWLTQRLCRELVKALAGHFSNKEMARSGTSPQNVSAVQGYLQQQAKEQRVRTSPIVGSPQRVELISKAQFRVVGDTVQLLLPLEGGNSAVFAMLSHEARQWLDVLYQQYRVAEWPLDVWPAWITSPAEEGFGGAVH